MASITSTITIIDRMTPVLDSIISSVQQTKNVLERADAATDRAFDTAQIYVANAQLSEIEEQLQRNAQRQKEFNDKIR